MRIPRQLFVHGAIALALMAFAAGSLRAQTGTLSGQVIDGNTLQPLAGAQISIPARNIGSLARADGRFLIPGIPTGTHVVEFRIIGYAVQTQEVTIVSGQSVTANVEMQSQAIALEELVVTGTGVVTERRRLGQTVVAVDAATLSELPVRNLTEALSGRVAGLFTSAQGELGGSSPIVMRGAVSLSQRNDPIIYVDGIRIDNQASVFASVQTSPLDHINPSDIERVEVIKGAAAATLYGTEASSGVIQIFTKRGTVGAPTYTFEVEQGATRIDEGRIPGNWKWEPVEDKMYFNDPIKDVILRTGHRQNYSASVRGGTPAVQYFASGRWLSETGNVPVEIGKLQNSSGRIGLTFQHTEKLETQLNLNVTRNLTRAPYPNFGMTGVLLSDPANTNPGRPFGELFGSVKGSLAHKNRLTHNQIVASGLATYRWSPGIQSQVTVGFNEIEQEGITFVPKGGEARQADGRRDVRAERRTNITLEAKTSWQQEFGENLSSTLVVGGQSFWEDIWFRRSAVRAFAAPTLETLRGGATVTSLDETFEEVINAGLFAQEQIGLYDKLFLTGGVRIDGNSAFGEDFGFQVYPKGGVSWVVSDHDFWNIAAIDQFRIRGAIGTSGLQPGSFDAQRTWQPAPFLSGAVLPLNLGNPDLGPERSIEREIAAEFGLFGGRIGLEIVYFNQETKDALIAAPFPVTNGFIQKQLTNAGLLESQGWEISTDVTWIQGRNFSLRTNHQIATLDMNVADLGSIAPFRLQAGRRWSMIREGFAPGDVITAVKDPADPYRLTVPIEQVNSIHNIQPNNLKNTAGGDSLAFVGHSVPTLTGTSSLMADLPGGFSLSALFTGASGFIISNETEIIRESISVTPRTAAWDKELDDPSTSTARKQEIADEFGPEHHLILSNWMVPGDYIRFQELGVTYNVPQSLLQNIAGGISSAQLMLSGRNVWIWSKYINEMNRRGSSATGDPLMTDHDGERGDLTTQALVHNIDWFNFPAPRRISLRARVTF